MQSNVLCDFKASSHGHFKYQISYSISYRASLVEKIHYYDILKEDRLSVFTSSSGLGGEVARQWWLSLR
jgi:hypothetical protein